MIDRATRLHWRRKFRRSKKQVEGLGQQAEVGVEKHFFNRISRLSQVRRFIAGWVVLFILLIGAVLFQTRGLGSYYLTLQPEVGGIYSEGIYGTFTNANPIYATGSVDNSVVNLVFAGLFNFDSENKLTGELAKSYTVDSRGLTYTVLLNQNLKWHDGKLLTADDVEFTYKMIQNPDAKSPLATSWQGISVKADGPDKVIFTLPNILSSFPYSLTNGIIPKHLLDGVPATQLRSVVFNTKSPVGSGPYKWSAIEVVGTNPQDREQRIALEPFNDYVKGKPNIEKFIVRTFLDEEKLADALFKREVNSAAGLSVVPEKLKDDLTIKTYNIPLTSQVLLFFKNTENVFKDVKVRTALSYAIDTKSLIAGISRPVGQSNSPLLKNQVGYDPTIVQNTNDIKKAQTLFDEAGWKIGKNNLRYKDNLPLKFTITTQENSTFDFVSQILKKQWEKVGVTVDIIKLSDTDLQSSLAVHNYEALLYGISIGPDPDVFAYWHSTQADLRSPNRLNFSEYTSQKADKALEGGRTRDDTLIRTIKYKPFLEAWRDDAPAIALYQPRYLYLVREPFYGFSHSLINSGSDRLNDVNEWKIRTSLQPIL